MTAAELWTRLEKTMAESLFASGTYDGEITRDEKLEMLGDELDMLELAMALEEEFGLDVDDDDLASWKTVGDIERWLTKALVS